MSEWRKRVSAVAGNPAWISFTWFGLTAGISLIATPVRFGVESLTRPVALDVARVVFAALNKAELVCLIILLLVLRLSGHMRRWWMLALALTLILVAQSVWLQPELSARTDQIIAGVEPGPSYAHAAYSVLELAKLGLLLVLGFRSLDPERRSG